MMDFMDWFFTLLAPISSVLVFVVIVACLLGLSFVASFLIAKFES